MEGLLGSVTKGLEKRHDEEEQKKKQAREDYWKIITAPPGTFSDETRERAWSDIQKGLNPEAKKGVGKFKEIFQKLKPPQQGQQPPAQAGGAPPPQQSAGLQPPPNAQAQAAPQLSPVRPPSGPLQPPQAPPQQAQSASAPQQQPKPPGLIPQGEQLAQKQKTTEEAETFKTNEEIRRTNAVERDKQAAKDTAEANLEKAAQGYAATLPEGEGKAFLKRFEEQHKFGLTGTDEPKPPAPEDMKNIPGAALKGQQDAFGNPVDVSGVYTKSKDGKLYPEAPAPKADAPEAAEVRERAKAYMDKGMAEAEATKKARADWVKEQNEKAKAVEVRVNAEAAKDAPEKPIEPNTGEFRIAQDLAYGKLTFQQFRSLLSTRSSGSSDANRKKIAIYDKAGELNPNFNPAQFEMGFKLASNPKVQQQLASLDNVKVGVDDLLKLSDAAERTGATILNKAVIPGGIAIGSHKYSDFKTARTAFADELSGALGYGSATDMSREMGFSMTDQNLSPTAFRSAIQDVIMPFVERKKKTLLNQMGVYGQPGMNPAAGPLTPPSGAPAPAGQSQAHTIEVNGKRYKYKGTGPTDSMDSYTEIKK